MNGRHRNFRGTSIKGFICIFALLLLFLFVLSARAETKQVPEDLMVSGAASLTNAFTELATMYEKKHPETHIYTNFAASNVLLQQMRQGAPVDVFAAADQETMDKAQAEKLLAPEGRRNFVRNSLVMIVPYDSTVKSIKELPKLKRIAVGNPDFVPAGRYARAALNATKDETGQPLWNTLQSQMVMGNNVRQVLDYVTRGEADAGFVYGSDAHKAGSAVRVVQIMNGHEPVLYPVAPVRASAKIKKSLEFIDFLCSPEAQKVLEKHGFILE